MITKRIIVFNVSFLFFSFLATGENTKMFIDNPPDEFNVIIKEKQYLKEMGEVVFNLKNNTLVASYGKEYTVRGEKIKSKTITTNFKNEDKVLIYEYIIRSQIFAIKEKKLNSLGSVKTFPHTNTIFNIVLRENDKYNSLECDVENLNIYNVVSPSDDINKLWTLSQIVNLLLKIRCNETIAFENWQWADFAERIKVVENGGCIFDNDDLPGRIFNSELKILKKYKNLLEKKNSDNLSEGEQETIESLRRHLFGHDMMKFVDLPYTGMSQYITSSDLNPKDSAKEPHDIKVEAGGKIKDFTEIDQITKDASELIKKRQGLDISTKEGCRETIKMYEEFLGKYKNQSDNIFYKGAKEIYETMKKRDSLGWEN